jgi:uncharacterized protein YhaN
MTQDTTEARRALELAEMATPGPWHYDDDDLSIFTEGGVVLLELDDTIDLTEEDATFIAAARTLLPSLARQVIDLAGKPDEANGQIAKLICDHASEIEAARSTIEQQARIADTLRAQLAEQAREIERLTKEARDVDAAATLEHLEWTNKRAELHDKLDAARRELEQERAEVARMTLVVEQADTAGH